MTGRLANQEKNVRGSHSPCQYLIYFLNEYNFNIFVCTMNGRKLFYNVLLTDFSNNTVLMILLWMSKSED